MARKKDITNEKHGCLNVIKYIRTDENGQCIWECKCGCGATVYKSVANINKNPEKCGFNCGLLFNWQQWDKKMFFKTNSFKIGQKIKTNENCLYGIPLYEMNERKKKKNDVEIGNLTGMVQSVTSDGCLIKLDKESMNKLSQSYINYCKNHRIKHMELLVVNQDKLILLEEK